MIKNVQKTNNTEKWFLNKFCKVYKRHKNNASDCKKKREKNKEPIAEKMKKLDKRQKITEILLLCTQFFLYIYSA